VLVLVPKSYRRLSGLAATVYLPHEAGELQTGRVQTLTKTKNNGMKKLAVGVAMTFLIGGHG
jgi:hypothetical protein